MQLELEIKKKASKKTSNSKLNTKTFVELFAGIGLVRMGLERTGWKCIYANDICADKRDLYVKNFGDDHFHLEDIWKVKSSDIKAEFDLMTASFPCTDLSLAGNRAGLAGQHSGTFWAFISLLKNLQNEGRAPKTLLVENVLGFMTSHNGEDFVGAVKALNELGYITDAFVVDAKHFTPQSRPRLFIVGVKKAYAPITAVTRADSDSEFERLLNRSDILWRPAPLRKIIAANSKLDWALFKLPESEGHSQRLVDIIEAMDDSDARWWDDEKVEKTISQMSELHLAKLGSLKNLRKYTFGTIYRRKREGGTKSELRLDGFAGCLRTPRGGSSRQIVAKIGNGKVKIRWMTPREYARLQGVEDSFILAENDIKSLFGFGDAVCVPAIEWIGRHVIDPVIQESSREVNKS